jgi:hypothetical protein
LPKAREGWEAFVVDTTYEAIRRNLARLHSIAGRRGYVAIALLALSCQASVSGDAAAKRVRADSEETPDFDKPVTASELAAKASPAIAIPDTALLGARHDLSLVGERANAACACVKVGIGTAQSAAFQWQSGMPHLSDDTQLAFAMSSENMSCTNEPKGSSGASYWGYRIAGNDVIVFVEGVREGRPRTSAAIIPKPVGDGQVYVAPAKNDFPYGRPLDGKGERCKVGNSATLRTTPFSQAELGDSSLKPAGTDPGVDDGE